MKKLFKKHMVVSNLYTNDMITALMNDSISARNSIRTLDKEDKTLYTPAELNKLRYFRITIQEFTRQKLFK